jgi:hypothetical protein
MPKIIRPEKLVHLQWLQILTQINGEILNKVKAESHRYIRSKMKECLKDKINELETISKNENTSNTLM